MRRLPAPSGPDVVAAAVLAYTAWFTTPAAASWLPGSAATPVWTVVVVVSGAAILVRSQAPLASILTIGVVLAVHLVAFSQLSILVLAATALATWTIQSRLVAPWRWGLLATVYAGTAVALVRVLPYLEIGTSDPVTLLIALVTGWSFLTMFALAGAARRRARERVEQALERAEILQAQQSAERRLAVSQERARIARDVHDLLGHSLAVIGMQAAGAQAVLRADPDAAEEALTVIGNTARRSVEEVRALIDVLREESPAGRPPQAQDTTTPDSPAQAAAPREAVAPEAAGHDTAGPASVAPNARPSQVRDAAEPAGTRTGKQSAGPGLDAVPALVSTFRGAGLDVALDLRVSSAVPEAAGRVLHDVTREALTNVVRHAPDSRVHVKARASSDALEVSVVNTTADAAGPAHPHGGTTRRGYGLESMRARLDAVGGHLSVGPTEAGWQVLAQVLGESAPQEEAKP